jgi:hypothetical protein
MSRALAVVLEDGRTCELPMEMDLKNEGLIFGSNLPVASMLLEDIAEDLNITPLSTFIKEEDYEEDEEEAEANIKWHDPKQGLETVQKLFSYLLAHPELDKSPEGIHWVLWDLRAIELILRDAVERNTQFYFVEW